jgi:hypothetical protein
LLYFMDDANVTLWLFIWEKYRNRQYVMTSTL